MKHVIIGTAGHVDHGKTTLIQALTGTNPDRLKEEQERGMTIDIGFASLRLPEGTIAGIVDVPGHERFLKNMLAGASGVDVVLLVIAADESVMPQTREHLDILRLLDVKNGVVALTKCDMVDRDWIETVEEDVRATLKGTFLENAPIIHVAAVRNKGIEALKKALLSAVSRAEARNASLPFRLPVDRVFTRPGFGTVVTGTLAAGTIHIGDAVEIAPQGITSRVRGLQVHGAKCTEAFAGMRVAVNIAGVETEAIERGSQIASPGTLKSAITFDAVLQLLPSAKPLRDRSRVRVHIGTAEVIGRVRILDEREALEAGSRAFVQFRSEAVLACARGDRFVVRSYSPMVTIGGGTVLDVEPPRHRKGNRDSLQALEARERGTPEDVVEGILQRFAFGLTKKELPGIATLPQEEADSVVQGLCEGKKAYLLSGERVIHAAQLQRATDRAFTALERYHQQYPLRSGMPKEELRGVLGRDCDPRAYGALVKHWETTREIVVEGSTVRKTDFQIQLNERQQTLLGRIRQYYQSVGIATPTMEEVSRMVQAPPDAIIALLRVGTERGDFIRVGEGVYYDQTTLDHLKSVVTKIVQEQGKITVGELRDATASNRKFALQLLEYLDSVRFTRRVGDERILFE